MAEPEIEGLQPTSGPPGMSVTVQGTAFGTDPSAVSVTFGDASAPVGGVTDSTIDTEVPEELEEGLVPVEVTIGEQAITGPDFTVERAAPGINAIDPESGTVGTEVTIEGMNFSPTPSENEIRFAGTVAPVTSAASDELQTEVPSGAMDGPVEVSVDGQTATGPDFDVIREGTLEVNTETTGSDKDSDGYTVTVNGEEDTAIEPSGTISVSDLSEGNHEVGLTGVSDNCSVEGANPRTVKIEAEQTTSTTFSVECKEAVINRIAFHTDRNGDVGTHDIYLMNADGSNQTPLTSNSHADLQPTISNDGTQIAFISDRGGNINLWVMNADGSNPRRVTSTGSRTSWPTWSPDDSRIAFGDKTSGNWEIYHIAVDGSDPQRLTNNSAMDSRPDWSPDGSQVAFASRRGDANDIWIMETDGTNKQNLSDNSVNDGAPNWSPNGSKIAFQTSRDDDDGIYTNIYTMDADGSALRRVTTAHSVDDQWPSWSPDGSELAFSTDRDGDGEIYKISADGSGKPVNLTRSGGGDGSPFWSPLE